MVYRKSWLVKFREPIYGWRKIHLTPKGIPRVEYILGTINILPLRGFRQLASSNNCDGTTGSTQHHRQLAAQILQRADGELCRLAVHSDWRSGDDHCSLGGVRDVSR